MGSNITVERDVMVSMRDGVKLATDVYRPADDARHPVLVQRTPYSKSTAWFVGGLILNPLDAAERGYAAVVQDTRGRFQSEGEWEPFVNEAADGHDCVEWAGEQQWSDGNVGIYGSSYMGVTVLQAAAAAPPHLKAAMSYLTGANYHDGWSYSGGAFELSFNLWWTNFLAWDTLARLDLSDAARQELLLGLVQAASDPWQAARHLPLREIPAFTKEVAPYWQEWLNHPAYDEYWERTDVAAQADRIEVPLLHITGWFDNFLRGHLDLNEAIRSRGDKKVLGDHRFVIGPWDHEAYLTVRLSSAGQREFGPAALSGAAGVGETAFQWFDHWLRGEDTAIVQTPGVRYFVMGENAWREAEAWPPEHTATSFYLHSGGGANGRSGDGALTTDAPGREPPDSYVYDPMDPVPSVGGRTLGPVFGPGGIQDQSRVEEREDVLVYTSPRLTRPVTIAGPLTVSLFAATEARDTDFTAKVVDVEPDGYCANIAEGIIRARYRNGMTREEFLEPGEPTEFTIDLWDVAHTFRPGHRIRLEVSSSNFPRFDRNLNGEVDPADGGPGEVQVAVQQVFHDADRPSRLILPVVER